MHLAQAVIDRARGGPLRENGLKLVLTTENDVEEMAKDWREWAQRDDASVAMLHGEIVIRK
jgi:hypothetical protein